MRAIAELAVRMARENPRWGYTRIQGALQNVGHRVGRTTVAHVLKRHGIDPAPERGKRTTWSQFLKAHWNVIAATDFFDVTDPLDGFLAEKRLLILGRNSEFSKAFRNLLKDAGIEVVRLPYRSPNLNAYPERFVRSIKDECLNRMIFFSERSLRRATREYAAHHHRERNHQRIDNRLIEPGDHTESTSIAIMCTRRIGGMLRFYHRATASIDL